MSTLLEAAKLVSRQFDEYRDIGFGEMAVLDAAIAAEEQRIADEQLPATREWLIEMLGPESSDRDGVKVWRLGDVVVSSCYKFVGVFANEMRVLRNPTRRQVLCLLEAMEVKA